jgi:pyruvate dehydrogenase E1 component alpha subunit
MPVIQSGAADDVLSFIDARGRLRRPLPEDLEAQDLSRVYEAMVLLRKFDERATALQRQGRIGNYPSYWGEEATQVGPALACMDKDWLFPTYRQGSIALLRDLEPQTILLYRSGRGGRLGFFNPRRYRIGPTSIAIASHLPHAVGLAWAAKIRGDSTVALAWFGDGATSEGDFHEAMNFAGVFQAPVVFFCVNNRWAISTPFSKQTASRTIADKGDAYDIPAVRVDGFDAVACWKATRDATARARRGGGPTLIEADCYRIGPHASADDPSQYRDETEVASYKELEPMRRIDAYLRSVGLLNDNRKLSVQAEVENRIADAVHVLDTKAPGPEIMFETVYASQMPWNLREGLSESKKNKPG